MVACQPAVELRLLFLVAADAESHLEINRLQTVHGCHLAMAVSAVQFAYNDMRLMAEFDKVRYKKNSDPRDGDILVKILFFLYQLRMFRNDIFMAEKTFFQGRQPGLGRTVDKWVTEAAVDLLDPGMYTVAEGNRLQRTDALRQI